MSPNSYFWWCGYFWGPWVPFFITDVFSVRVSEITLSIGVSWTHSLPFCFWPIFKLWIMAILSKECKLDNFESHSFVKLSFMNIQASFEFYWKWIFPLIKLWHSCYTCDKLGWLNWFWQFFCEKLSSVNPKGFCNSYAWSCSLCERRTFFCTRLISIKFCEFLFIFWLALLHSVSYFFFL